MPKDEKFRDYARCAERCLNMVAATTDQESRCIQGAIGMEKGRHSKLVITSNEPQMASINLSPLGRLGGIQNRHAWVDGSQTGIPVSEVTVTEPPAPIPIAKLTTPAKSGPSYKEGRR